jgi:hypothetical protein
LPQKETFNSNGSRDLAEMVSLIVNKDHAFNFDITLELAMPPRFRVGTLRVTGKVESVGSKRSK